MCAVRIYSRWWLQNYQSVRIKLGGILISLLIGLWLTQCSMSGTDARISRGGTLFLERCSVCHGAKAVGGDPGKPNGYWISKTIQIAPALNGTGHAWHHPPELLLQKIRYGLADEQSVMPLYGYELSPMEIKTILSYIESLWPEEIKKKYEERYRDSRLFDL